MRTVDSRCRFAGLTTASIPTIVQVTEGATRIVTFRSDQPLNRLLNSAAVAAQFQFTAGAQSPFGSFAETISSTIFRVGWIGLFPPATSVTYIPNGERITSRLGGELAGFTKAIPFP